MARPVVYHWKASDTSAVCRLQSTAGAASLILDGSEVSAGIATFPGVQRTVSLTSANNLSALNFTITGTLDNKVVSVTRTGPNANTVYTSQLFTTVTSVTVDGAANAVSIGSGVSGQTNWFGFNFQQTYSALTVTISNVAGTIDVTAATTVDDVNTNPDPYLFDGITNINNATADAFGSLITPIRFSTILVVNTTGSFTATFLQQGIT